jgi:uncharacterized protein YihD (DUF1040 family)
MRDAKRIDKILKIIAEVWKKNPDLRLGQLLLDAVNSSYLYYIEDEQLTEELQKFAARYMPS